MKNLIILLSILFLNALFLNAQTNNVTYSDIPGIIAYQAIAYNSQGNPLVQQNITLRASVLKHSVTGSVEYQEIHSVTTADDGFFEIRIGDGTWTSGNFATISDIDWGADRYFLKMEIDASGGFNFGDAGTESFCSVPYAFHASVSDSISGISTDTLRFVGAGGCPCTLQDAYNNSVPPLARIIQNTNNNQIWITANVAMVPFNAMLQVESNGAYNHGTGYFRINNATNNSISLFARTAGNGNAFQAQNGVLSTGNTAINSVHQGIGNAVQALTTNGANTAPTVQAQTSGTGNAGYFEIRNQLSTRAAILGIIPTVAPPTLHAEAGQFFIDEALNDAIALDVETNGSGSAGTFNVNIAGGTTNSADGLFTTHNGTGNSFRSRQTGTAGRSGLFEITQATNTSEGILVTNSGGGIGTYVNNVNTANGSFALVAANRGLGIGGLFFQTNTANPNICVAATTNGTGRTGFFTNSNSNNSSNVVEIAQTGIGTLLEASTGTAQLSGRNVAHFNIANVGNGNSVVKSETTGDGGVAIEARSNAANNGVGVTSFASGTNGIAGTFFNTNTLNQQHAIIAINANNSQTSSVVTTAVAATAWEGDILHSVLLNTNPNPLITTNAIYAQSGVTLQPTIWAGNFAGDVNISGIAVIGGSKSAIIKNGQGVQKLMYCDESTEIWFSDMGFGQLTNGIATVNIDPEFLSTVNTNLSYHALIQLEGPCNDAGVYVTNKTATSFDVVQQNSNGNNCNASFSYTIKAKRKGFESLRLATVQQTKTVNYNYYQQVWPEEIARQEAVRNQTLQLVSQFSTTPSPSPAGSPNINIPEPSSVNTAPAIPAKDGTPLEYSGPEE